MISCGVDCFLLDTIAIVLVVDYIIRGFQELPQSCIVTPVAHIINIGVGR